MARFHIKFEIFIDVEVDGADEESVGYRLADGVSDLLMSMGASKVPKDRAGTIETKGTMVEIDSAGKPINQPNAAANIN